MLKEQDNRDYGGLGAPWLEIGELCCVCLCSAVFGLFPKSRLACLLGYNMRMQVPKDVRQDTGL